MATARGAAEAGALLILSSLATCPLEDVAAAAPDAPRWMQIYVLRERARTEDLVRRAAAHGYRALVLTVDAPVSGLRLREWRIGVHLPDDLALPNLAGDSTDSAREGGFMAVVTNEFEPALTPDDIGWLAGLSALPVVVKGVQRADDAVRCCRRRGGGRRGLQPRGPPARRRAGHRGHSGRGRRRRGGRAEVYVDGGVRRAPDVVKALALGARATLVGRPSLWALATGGADGVAGLLRWYEAELRRTMHLCGAATVDALDRTLVRRTPGWDRAMTTVAALLVARAEDDRTGVMDADGRWTWREAVHEGATRGALARSLFGDGQAAHRRAPAQWRRVPLLAERRRAGRCRHRRDQPDAAGRGPGRRRAGH